MGGIEMSDNIFLANRQKFFDKMEDGSLLVIFAGEPPLKRGDELYAFSPQRNFYYLTGITSTSLILLLAKKDKEQTAMLFLERADDVTAKWDGAVLSKEEATGISGIEKFKFIDEFHRHLQRMLFRDEYKTVYLDLEHRYWNAKRTPDVKFAGELREKYPVINIIDAYPMLAELRLIKGCGEIDKIQKAVDLTRDGVELMMKNCKPGMREYEVEAYFDFAIKKGGASGFAFKTIAAGGKNATILHYLNNDQIINDGDLLLLDLGAQYQQYSADISRTFPVNGKFSERQKQIYNIVLEANERVIAAIKPGAPYADLNKIVKDWYAEELARIGLIEKAEDVDKYYYHGVSHSLGLETHDISRGLAEGCLKEGMALTVEPGLYIEEEGIGVRIEDDVLVTAEGCKVLSAAIPKTVEDIERVMGS